ncbi:MAG TPA: hypothetical protein VGH80_06805 [Xanthomonadaceae bacterium]|jgi:hypothetical protein
MKKIGHPAATSSPQSKSVVFDCGRGIAKATPRRHIHVPSTEGFGHEPVFGESR